MAFGTFKSLEEVVLAYSITLQSAEFLQPVSQPVPEGFQKRLRLMMANAPVRASEQAVCEFLIAPVLQEVWLSFMDALMMWSHVALSADATLSGFPDYFFAKRSPLGPVRDRPYVLFVEAKKDDFDAGWGQCLAAMLAAQQLNQMSEQPILGGVSSGVVWNFGKLQGKTLTQDPREYPVNQLPELFAALHYIFAQAKQLALASPPSSVKAAPT